MKTTIKTKNIELTDSLEAYINKRIKGLEKFLQPESELSLIIEKETNHHKKGDIFMTEAMVHVPGKQLLAKAHGDDLGKTVTKVANQLKEEIKQHKLKTIELPRRQARKAGNREIF